MAQTLILGSFLTRFRPIECGYGYKSIILSEAIANWCQ